MIESYLMLIVATNLFYPVIGCEVGLEPFSPSKLYKNTNMNWFGCCLVSVALFIIFPMWGIIAFIWWISHVGRE